jgi:hypothetical protein
MKFPRSGVSSTGVFTKFSQIESLPPELGQNGTLAAFRFRNKERINRETSR